MPLTYSTILRHRGRALALNGRVGDLGLLSEEYHVGRRRQVGNFPQAFSHLTLIGAASAIWAAEKGSKK